MYSLGAIAGSSLVPILHLRHPIISGLEMSASEVLIFDYRSIDRPDVVIRSSVRMGGLPVEIGGRSSSVSERQPEGREMVQLVKPR
jgi:hypothetical protein